MGLVGSIFGGAIGFTLGGPIGAVVGSIIGHRLGESAKGPASGGGWRGEGAPPVADSRQEAQAVFFVTTFSMLAKMAKADGRVSEEEIALIQRFMREQLRLSPEDERYAIEIFRNAKDSPHSFEDFARQFAQVFSSQPRMREIMLDLLVRLAAADGTVHPAEESLLRRAAEIFGLGEELLEGVLGRHPADPSRHYAVLGLSAAASDQEIKARYRQLVVQYHPDKIMAKGLPPEFVELAQKRFTEIQAAYEAICAARGLH